MFAGIWVPPRIARQIVQSFGGVATANRVCVSHTYSAVLIGINLSVNGALGEATQAILFCVCAVRTCRYTNIPETHVPTYRYCLGLSLAPTSSDSRTSDGEIEDA